MSQKTVKFVLVDAPLPVKHAGLLALKAPLDLELEAGKELHLDLGFTCDHALLILSSGVLEVVGSGLVVGGPAKVTVRAKDTGRVSRGERVLFAMPLGLEDFGVERA